MILQTGPIKNNFSLIEILIMTSLIALVMGIASVSFSGVTKEGRFRHAVNTLVKHIDTIRHRAVSMQKPLRLVYDLSNNAYWAEILPAQRGLMSDDKLSSLKLKKYYLPKNIFFEEIQLSKDKTINSDSIALDIDKNGMVSNHHIYLKQDEYVARIEVHSISGLIEVVQIDNGILADDWPSPSFGHN